MIKLREQRFDGMLFAVVLPRRDGFDVLQALRKQPLPMRTAIVMLTVQQAEVRGNEEAREHLIRLGADDVAFWGSRTRPEEIAGKLLRLLGI